MILIVYRITDFTPILKITHQMMTIQNMSMRILIILLRFRFFKVKLVVGVFEVLVVLVLGDRKCNWV